MLRSTLAFLVCLSVGGNGLLPAGGIDGAEPFYEGGEEIARVAFRSLPETGRRWGTEQMIGAPNTLSAGDIPTAWASATPDGQDEWIECGFEKPVVAAQVTVFETYNPGAISKVTVYGEEDISRVIFEGEDPTSQEAGRGISNFPVDVDFRIVRVRVDLKSMAVPGWNEIDAVGLRLWNGETVWASEAKASSIYGVQASTPSEMELLKAEIAELRQMVKNLRNELREQAEIRERRLR